MVGGMMSEKKVNYKAQQFAKDSVSYSTPSIKSPKKYSKQNILTYLESPFKNSSALQEASAYIRYNNGVYNRIIKYFASMPTFDCMLYPIEVDSKKSTSGEKLMKSYQETAKYLEALNPKYNLGWMIDRLLQDGELYLYKIEDSQSIVYKQMPTDLCRISSVEDNVCKYAIDIRKLNTKSIYDTMPVDLQKLSDKYQSGGIKAEDLIDNGWYELEENAVAFNAISQFLPKGFPPFSYLFDGLMHLDEMKQLHFNSAKANNLKIIHQKVPIDDDGELLIDYDLVKEYHSSTKRNLPDGIAITTNPLDLQSITLSRTGAEAINQRNDALESLLDDAGVNSEIFNGSKSTNEAIAMGVKVDEMFINNIISMFENFLNYEIAKNKKTSSWRVKLFNSTYFSRDEYIKRSRENLQYGGSRLEYLAVQGFTPLQGYNVLKGEQALGIDKILIPQQSSHTMTSSDNNGRPSKEDSDNTDSVAKTPENQ
jgi:hypothetical protein